MTQNKSDYLGLLTPNLHLLTALQDTFTVPTAKQELPFPLPYPSSSPLNLQASLQKEKLFSDSAEISEVDMESESWTQQSQSNTQDLLDVCSGKFTGIQSYDKKKEDSFSLTNDRHQQFEDDLILNQVLKEDEMEETYKRKLDEDFESVSLLNAANKNDESLDEELVHERFSPTKKQTKRKYLQFSGK